MKPITVDSARGERPDIGHGSTRPVGRHGLLWEAGRAFGGPGRAGRTARFAAISGGGTASHALLTVAIARALVARGLEPGSLQLIGSKRGREESVMAGQGFPLLRLSGRGLRRSRSAAHLPRNLAAVAGLTWASLRAFATFLRHRPRVVVGTGGYASLAAGLAAAALRIPLVLLNADVEPGLANRVLGRVADACAVANPGTRLPHAVVTGVPLRPQVLAVRRTPESRRRARSALGIPEGRRTVCFAGGSLGALRINQAAASLAQRWSAREDLAIYHVTGRRDYEEVAGSAGGAGGPAAPGARGLWRQVVSFQDHMEDLYEAADVMVCRAGAMTVAELAAAGVPSVLIPLAGAPRDHQTKNARVLEHAGAAVLVPDLECQPARLESVLDELLGDPARLGAMADAARGLGHRAGHRQAAARIAELVCQVAGGRKAEDGEYLFESGHESQALRAPNSDLHVAAEARVHVLILGIRRQDARKISHEPTPLGARHSDLRVAALRVTCRSRSDFCVA